ncbi:MAG: hypothetical protein GFH27_549283n386 [Chloroflexi bacterium AL-W]|nr:hypothetical protein [Chloroflexi bacterium AL-N1]NOK64492.1 hypothetical protein [Chloroflexi bacterium AL-N10]NOK75734.1 hypothetical protein [Chloroflexi bacterium AL-N5]NOK80507.1 hypothetical protein [Chloroflexi bacterium AL-W]NOK87021.1 hypothetical protein [Chloroflexi bacterium AL-N15]
MHRSMCQWWVLMVMLGSIGIACNTNTGSDSQARG